ncbi:RNase H domain-containing protein [Trichonephila clavipes]|nr:RNase H domain-containing protein [Trichonephila clavipes]
MGASSSAHHIFKIWQESLGVSSWITTAPVFRLRRSMVCMPMQRTDVKLTCLALVILASPTGAFIIGQRCSECPSCMVCYTVRHILLRLAPFFNTYRMTFFNKLHSVKPVIGAWPVMPMRRTDVKLTRLRIGHPLGFTHRHLLLGEDASECPSCMSLLHCNVAFY